MKPLSRRTFGLAVAALAVVMFIAVNVASNVWLRTARIDLTEAGLYTVSEGTHTTLQNLEELITLRFFFSRDATTGYPSVNTYARRVRDLLHEYEALAGGNIILEEINPQSFTPAEDEAVAAGLTGIPAQAGETIYFGLAGSNTLDGSEIIAFFDSDREPYLEYDLTSLIYRLATPERSQLGLISSLPLAQGIGGMLATIQGTARPFAIYMQLNSSFELTNLDTDVDRIPEDISTLMVVHPTGLSESTLYAIDQFVLRGGHALIFVDPLSEIATNAGGGIGGQQIAPTSNIAPLLEAWGVSYDASRVLADGTLAQRVRFGGQGRVEVLSYIVWLRLASENFNTDDVVVANLNQINVATPGALAAAEGATTQFTPLFVSSDNSAFLDGFLVRNTQDPQELMRLFAPTGVEHTIAARIAGPAASAYPDGPPEPELVEDETGDEESAEPLPPHLGEAENINVMLVADTDLFDDRFWVQIQNILGQQIFIPNADNGAFIISAVENMMGSNELISLRTRARSQRPFTVVEELQREAEARFLAEEQILEQRLTQTETRLRELQSQGGTDDVALTQEVLSSEQREAVENFRRELIETRVSLREVQANLRRDVEALGGALAFLNIAFVPMIVTVAATGLAVLRRRRRMKARGF